ncbi:hypothetical protein UCDDA912_g01009 [Diaporthe ampelina]|uniref:Uncharacterized protein n=1 Tax=Diaporthe ampelina TaxID=1214573 RepID=A0A0G2FXW1_9PEZI|nr:hypothetical protein UCDDA912_g01009 [Diaporthe ampelina]
MPPNDKSGWEDFVFVDDPLHFTSLKDLPIRNGTRKFPFETDYVTVDINSPITSTMPDVLAASTPDEHEDALVQIEDFEPMRLNAFPEEITQVALMAPAPTEHETLEDDDSEPSSPTKPQALLVKNANLLFECFFHFKSLCPKIGRDSVLYMVGKACGLKPERSSTLQRHVGCTLDTLREARAAFLQTHKNRFVPRAENDHARQLARLVNRYISFTPVEPDPRDVDKMWYKDPALESLWFEWQEILESKGLRIKESQRWTGKDNTTYSRVSLVDTRTVSVQNNDSAGPQRSSLVWEAVRAAGRLEGFLIRLEACGGPADLNETEKRLIRRALDRATRWTDQIKGKN